MGLYYPKFVCLTLGIHFAGRMLMIIGKMTPISGTTLEIIYGNALMMLSVLMILVASFLGGFRVLRYGKALRFFKLGTKSAAPKK